jgi:thiamine biosynthesis lipoprotein
MKQDLSPTPHVNRRRFIQIVAGVALTAGCWPARQKPSHQLHPYIWKGRLLGAETSLTLYHSDQDVSKKAVTIIIEEMRRLAQIFSLYETTSEISRLNSEGSLINAAPELLELLSVSSSIRRKTDGLFDPTMQPLFALYADYFSNPTHTKAPPQNRVTETLNLVGLDKVKVEENDIAFSEAGMALSFNGIAQGYLTDRAHKTLADLGFKNALINMGEYRALGAKPDINGSSAPWNIGVADALAPWQLFDTLAVIDKAVATSAPNGAAFDNSGQLHHLINPTSGLSPNHYISVTVTAPNATLADGLSTALTLAPPAKAEKILSRFRDVGALLRPVNGPAMRINL